MRILLSAFACDPNQGSEPGAGWAWATQLARSGHRVCVVTREVNRAPIEAYISLHPQPNLRFLYVGMRRIPHKYVPGLGIYPYYFAWQLKIFLSAKTLFNLSEIDCIHHLTFGSYRTPFFLSLLNKPSIFGPVAGGEVIPIRLTRGMSLGARFREFARMCLNLVGYFNPLTRIIWRRCTLILGTTEQTLRMVPSRYQAKSRLLLAVTAPPSTRDNPISKPSGDGRLRVLFVGRLLEWKGLHLAIKALSIARRTSPGITLSIVGSGPLKSQLEELIRTEKLEDSVEWVPRVPREKVMEIYDRHDLLHFPSLRDAGGMVILEAFSRGVPVLCLNLPGTKVLVNSSCGISIETEQRSVEELVQSMAEALIRFSSMSDAEKEAFRQAAYDRAEEFTGANVIGKAYSWFSELSNASRT